MCILDDIKRKLLGEKVLERISFILFSVSFIIISIVHEPWFDEAQAWEIAKGASLREILFILPHYEGHPPLWHLLLALPAKIGVPYEIGLKTTGAVISTASAGILVFKSRLPRLVRFCLPFHYFFFYQCGVITRPYGLMILIMLLLGMHFSERSTHPWRIVVLLGALCLCSAYGIVLAGGIAICLVIDLLREKGMKAAICNLFHDSRSLSLLALLAMAVLLLLEIMPRADTYYAAQDIKNSFLRCFPCALLIFPAECFLTTASWFSMDRTLLQTSHIGLGEMSVMCLIGVVLWIFLLCSASKKSLHYLLLPYILFAVFSALAYFSGHHLGVVFTFLLFWAEFVCREEERFGIGSALMKKIAVTQSDATLLQKTYCYFGIACLIIPIVWTFTASVHDINGEYYYSQEASNFLKEHGLDNLAILGAWNLDGSSAPFSNGDKNYVNTVMIGTAVPMNAYFDRNIFFNLNHGNPKQGFLFHRSPSPAESKADLVLWKTYGKPDVIIGKPDLKKIYGNETSFHDYSLVAVIKSEAIWKTNAVGEKMPIFLRSDLLDVYKLKALEGIEYSAFNGLRFTKEMKERYYNGESMEEILNPYFDAFWGVGE